MLEFGEEATKLQYEASSKVPPTTKIIIDFIKDVIERCVERKVNQYCFDEVWTSSSKMRN